MDLFRSAIKAAAVLAACGMLASSGMTSEAGTANLQSMQAPSASIAAAYDRPVFLYVDASMLPPYSGSPYIVLNNNIPGFSDAELTTAAFETYANTDALGRCGVCYANVGREIMPTEGRGPIGEVKPTGWQQNKYPGIVDSEPPYLYNRCHLIGFQLSGETANERNLITGTRYMNVEGMLPFEDRIANYVKSTGNHVLYRVTPIFLGNNLLASGVEMEAKSVEDNGAGVSFHVYAYNVQPGIAIDYATGVNALANGASVPQAAPSAQAAPQASAAVGQAAQTVPSEYSYVLNKNTHVFHYPDCKSVRDMKEKNKIYSSQSRDEIQNMGYKSCGNCHP